LTAPGNEGPTGADVFLDILRNFGVEYIFSSPGTEWAPLWESLARQQATGARGPRYLCSRHEDLAIGMASGYSKATGKLSVCLLHSSVGSLRAAMGVRGAYQAQVPILVCAGESLTFGEGAPWVGFHWGRYLEDYGGPARLMEPLVKSSFTVHTKSLLAGSVHRACQLAMAAPRGPVFLSCPYEVNAERARCEAPVPAAFPSASHVDPQALAEVAALLARSRHPVIVTEKLGRDPGAVADLVAIAEAIGAVLIEAQHPEHVNFPRDHGLHGGYHAAPCLRDADLVLVVDVVGPPWYPEAALRPRQATVIAIGDDPLRARFPYYGIAPDLTLQGSPGAALAGLRALLPEGSADAARRTQEWTRVNVARRSQWHEAARRQAAAKPIDARWLCEVLNDAWPRDGILVDETILTNFTLLHGIDRLGPGQYINAMDGGLGTGLGAALGVKVAHPDRPVIALLGDGAFNYNPPLAAVGFCQEYGVPITIVIGDNGRYRAMQMATEQLYPDGWAKRSSNYYGSFIAPQIDYAAMADLVGGYGEQISEPGQIEPAFRRALQANAEGRVAILDVLIGDEMEYLGPMMKGSA
jgi:acetolactate synthase-1/2/3 large subunit